ncbi:hypothetical protein ACSBR2_020169 [Camellia fascicularis]
MVIHLRAIAILILKLSPSRFCGVRLCGFGTLRLLRSVRSEVLHHDETPLQSSLLSELNVDGDLLMELGAGVELATTVVPDIFLPLACAAKCGQGSTLLSLIFFPFYKFRLIYNVDAVTSTSTRTPILREMEENKDGIWRTASIFAMAPDNSAESNQRKPGLLKDQVQLVKQKDIDRYEIVPIQDPLSFEKGFFIVIRACQLLAQKNDGLILVGLAGPSGAGKTVY